MNPRTRNLLLGLLGLCVVAALFLATREEPAPQAPAPVALQAARPAQSPPATPPAVPPYHASAEAARPFPQLVPASVFRAYPAVERAYAAAARIPEVLAQQPCYCWCDKFGHGSLLDCFASDHGAG